jgi:hypothetical protein
MRLRWWKKKAAESPQVPKQKGRAEPADEIAAKDSTMASDYDEIKILIEPYLHIYNMTIQAFDAPVIHQVDFRLSTKATEPTSITSHVNFSETGDVLFAPGSAAFPPLLIPLKLGFLKSYSDDLCVQYFLWYIDQELDKVGARTHWITVVPKREAVFYYNGVTALTQTVRHSLFGITSRNGHKFVADCT